MKHNVVCTVKHLSDNFPIQNGIKQRDALSPGPEKPGGAEIEWDISAAGLC
jgi:hypothetical protein